MGNLALTSGRLLQLRNGTTVLGSSTALTVGTVYRVGLRQQKGTGANGVLQAVLAVGEAAFGSPFAQSSSQSFTTQASQVWLGATGSVATSITVDDVALDTAGFAGPSGVAPTRVTSYDYDRVNRLISAVESPGSSFSYPYDRRGNRTLFGRSFNAADQVNGWSYDAAGNLANDGTSSYSYDALNRLLSRTTSGITTTYSYNGDGTLVAATTGGTTTHYAQDLAAPLSQVLQTLVGGTRTSYLYGRERLAIAGSPRTWYLADGLGSARRTLNDSGAGNRSGGHHSSTLSSTPQALPDAQ